jgi:hypothetical protein
MNLKLGRHSFLSSLGAAGAGLFGAIARIDVRRAPLARFGEQAPFTGG